MNANNAGASGDADAGDGGDGDGGTGGSSAGKGGSSAGKGGSSGRGGSSAGKGGASGGKGGTGGTGGASAGSGGSNAGNGGSNAGSGGSGLGGSTGTGGANGGNGGSGGAGCVPALAPRVQFVAPYLALPNRASSLIVRGTALKTGGAITVNVGATSIGPLSAESDTQVTVQVPALAAGRYPVSVERASCSGGSDAELVVQPGPTVKYRAISAPTTRERLVWDAERQTLYAANRKDQAIERYQLSDVTWTTLTPYIIPDLTDIALAPNGRSLIISTRGAIYEAQLGQTSFSAVYRAANPDTSCGGYFNQLAMANDGTFLVTFKLAQCSGFTSSYLYDMRDHSLTTAAGGSMYNGFSGGSLDGSRIYLGGTGLSPAQQVKIFNALNHQIVAGTPSYGLSAISVSSNASRVILEKVDVYNSVLTLTGRLPTNAIALASLDSSRAFAFGEVAEPSRLFIHDLNGALESGGLYPVVKSIGLEAVSSPVDDTKSLTMASTHDDSMVFLSGNRNILVVPVQ